MKIITTVPYTVVTRLGRDSWEVLCTPGPLANMFRELAGLTLDHAEPIEEITIGDTQQSLSVIPLTKSLDEAITILVDTFIEMRYSTNQVQLKLFTDEEI